MSTVLYSKIGDFKAIVIPMCNREDDGFHYKVIQTNKIYNSEKKAIRNARNYLKKCRKNYIPPPKRIKRKRNNPRKVKVKRKRMKPRLNA